MADVLLNVVDEQDNVVGQALRSDIYKHGLRHREVHVWFVTPDNQLVFQRRSPTKDTYPNYLEATVGGHVELGQSYEDAALAEIREETGMALHLDELVPLTKVSLIGDDKERGLVNRAFQMTFAYRFRGQIADLKTEASDGAGFEILSFEEAAAGESKLARQIIPGIFTGDYILAWNVLRENFF